MCGPGGVSVGLAFGDYSGQGSILSSSQSLMCL